MALPKGGLVPNHVLILPIGHFAATTDVTEVCKTSIIHNTTICRCLPSCFLSPLPGDNGGDGQVQVCHEEILQEHWQVLCDI